MGPRHPAYLFLLIFSPCILPLLAQETPRPGEYTPTIPDSTYRQNAASILFDRNENTYNWVGRLTVDTSWGGTSLSYHHLFASNIIQVEASGALPQRRLESNQHNILMGFRTPVAPDLQAQALWSSLLYSDDKDVGLSNASDHAVLGGLEYHPLQSLTLLPMAGYRWDNQAQIHDRGPSVRMGATLNDVSSDGYEFSGRAQFHRDYLDPRRLESHFAHAGIQKLFSPMTHDSLEAGISRTRREFYALADSNIESRLEDAFYFSNLLDYAIDPNVVATMYVAVAGRGLDKDLRFFGQVPSSTPQFGTHIDEFRLDAAFGTTIRSDDGRHGGSVRLAYSERNESHAAKSVASASPAATVLFNERNKQEQTKDNLARRSSLTGSAYFPLSGSDNVTIAGAASILRYDTPSELNLEDRDELLTACTITSSHRVNRYLDLGISLEGNLSHLVYLLKERSANNNINRVLRLAPKTMFHPSPLFMSLNAFEVLANYTVYDFEQQAALTRSFSYRQFGWFDSTSFELTHSIGIDCFVYLKLYERGQLKWTEFTEQLEDSFVDRTYAVQVRYSPDRGTVFALGLRFFGQSRYEYTAGEKKLSSYLTSFGPTCLIVWKIGPHSEFGLRGWYENKKQIDGTSRSLASMSMNISVNF